MTEHNIRQLWTDDELDEALNGLRAEGSTDERPLAAAHAALLGAVQSIEGEDTAVQEKDGIVPTETERSSARPTGRRWWLAAAAAAAVIAVGGTAVITGTDQGAPAARSSVDTPKVRYVSVQQALGAAADQIDVTGEAPIPAGKFRYIATRTWKLYSDERIPIAVTHEQLAQTWQPSDFDGQWLLTIAPTGQRRWLAGSEQDLKAFTQKTEKHDDVDMSVYWPSGEWRAPGGRFPGLALSDMGRDDNREWGTPSKQRLDSLPRDPQKLYDLMAADPSVGPKPGLGGVLNIATELLKSGTVPADLKEAIYRAVAKVPDLKVTDQVANLDGRTGVAMGVEPGDGSLRMEIIVDPATGEYIGERRTQLKPYAGESSMPPGVEPGTVVYSSSVTTAIADQQGAAPSGS